jgi:hypothetical protein
MSVLIIDEFFGCLRLQITLCHSQLLNGRLPAVPH